MIKLLSEIRKIRKMYQEEKKIWLRYNCFFDRTSTLHPTTQFAS